MKRSLTKIVLGFLLASMPLIAADSNYRYDSYSLFAVEGGYTTTNADVATAGGTYDVQETGMGNVGLKLGAQTENYRVFFSARHFLAEDFSKFNTLGAEVQYMFNFSKYANFFIGANGGAAFMKIASTTNYASVSSTSTYFGGDAGFNIHVSKTVDFELGAKYMAVDFNEVVGPDTYSVDGIFTGYASVIIKWKMD